ncbi:MAG: PspC domain-containing protein [Coriobacteriales bacterium]|jgi:phage shock protein C|nr:PspC domain-containing protein [Coriobacteriales bacterium]
MNRNKRLCKSDDAIIAGVCGGIADYFELDATLIRILTVIFVLAGFGFPIIIYLIAMIVMPKRSGAYPDYIDVKPNPVQAYSTSERAPSATAASAAAAAPNAETYAEPYPNVHTTEAAREASMETPQAEASFAQAAAAKMPASGIPPAEPFAPGTVGAPGATGAAGVAGAANTAGATGTKASDTSPSQAHTTRPHATGTSATGAPGCAYTACNPQTYDASNPADQNTSSRSRIHTGIALGILLVAIGILALLGTFFELSIWNFWPLVIVAFGFVALCTPGKNGWSLARAGHAIFLITVGVALQFWTLEIITASAFILTFVYLWPVLLVAIGLFIIGGATEKSIFNLCGSLLLSIALIVGIWNFGEIGRIFVFLPPFSPPESHSVPWGGIWPFN